MTIKPLLAAAILFGAATLAHAQTAPAVVGNNATNPAAVTSVPYTAPTKAKANAKPKAKAKAHKVKHQPKNKNKAKAHAVKAKKPHATIKAKSKGPGLQAY